jgi:hypothetical protein
MPLRLPGLLAATVADGEQRQPVCLLAVRIVAVLKKAFGPSPTVAVLLCATCVLSIVGDIAPLHPAAPPQLLPHHSTVILPAAPASSLHCPVSIAFRRPHLIEALPPRQYRSAAHPVALGARERLTKSYVTQPASTCVFRRYGGCSSANQQSRPSPAPRHARKGTDSGQSSVV